MRERQMKRFASYKRMIMLLHLLLLAVFIAGCQPPGKKPDVLAQLEQHRANYPKAVMCNKQGLENIDDQDFAEAQFRKAIDADGLYGPAHNNLAIILADKGGLYEAAKHFRLAAKYMPGNVEPLMNLGQLLEKDNRLSEAIELYEQGLTINPEDIRLIQALSRVKIKAGQKDDRLRRLLNKVALEGQGKQWRDWAGEHLTDVSSKDSG